MGLISRVSSRTYRKRKEKKSLRMAQKAICKHPLLKKRNKKFARNQIDRFVRIRNSSWRRPKGIDSAFRRRFSGQACHPGIGYGTNKDTRHTCRDHMGFKKFLVHNVDELNCLMMSNRQWACEIAKGVSSKKRKSIVERAQALNVHVTNSKAKLRSEENE